MICQFHIIFTAQIKHHQRFLDFTWVSTGNSETNIINRNTIICLSMDLLTCLLIYLETRSISQAGLNYLVEV